MKSLHKTLRWSVALALTIGSLTSSAYGLVGGLTGSVGGESRSMIQLKGNLVCAQCSLDEVRHGQPSKASTLYQLTHQSGQVVIDISRVDDTSRWNTLLGPHRLSVRAHEQTFKTLMAEENMFKEVEITGMLRNTRTFDVANVTVNG